MISFKTIRSLTVVVALGGTSFPMVALSEQLPARGPVSFSAYDQNKDGFVSKEEFNAVREKLMADGRPMRNALPFEDIDLNHDGKLSPEEYSAHQSARMGKSPRAGAGPGAGMRGMMPSFSEFDLNKDGKITEEEFTDARTARITKRLQEGYQMRGLANAPSFADIDTNHDGAISPEEFSAHQSMHQQQRRP
jgi:Ca2+-binding EF-hand superfamily protein